MNSNMAFYAVQTKIAAKKAKILNNINWDNLLACSTVDQLKSILLSSGEFEKILTTVKSDNINRDSLEAILGRFATMETEDLLHYFSGHYKEFIEELLLESEIKDVSLILRKIARQESLEDINSRFVHSDKYTKLDFDKLLQAKNIKELIENLKGTPYYAGLKNLTAEDAIKREFHIEMKLYTELYKRLFEKSQSLDKLDREAVKNMVGLKIDLLNVQWVYRALNYYKISPEQVLFYSLLGGKSLDYKQLKKLCYSKSQDEFNKILKTNFKLIYKDRDSAFNINYYMNEYLKKEKFKNIGIAVAYIYWIDIIVYDITTIIEGIKYNLPKDNLKDYLAYSNKRREDK